MTIFWGGRLKFDEVESKSGTELRKTGGSPTEQL